MSSRLVWVLACLLLPGLFIPVTAITLAVKETLVAVVPAGIRSRDIYLSPDHHHIAYPLFHEQKQIAVIDGISGPAYDLITGDNGEPSFAFVFSPDSRHSAYRARRGNAQFFVIDGKESAAYDEVGFLFGFRPRDHAFLCTARHGKNWYLVVNGQKSRSWDQVLLDLSLTANAQPLYYARQGKSWHVVVGDQPGPGYDEIAWITQSQDGQHLAYTAKQSGEMVLVNDGKEIQHAKAIDAPIFSPDSRRMACPVYREKQGRMLLDGQLGPEYPLINYRQFSLDSKHFAYVARQKTAYVLVLDGKVITSTEGYPVCSFQPGQPTPGLSGWR